MGEVWRLTPFTPEQREQIVSELLRLVDEAFDGSARTRGIERYPHETPCPAASFANAGAAAARGTDRAQCLRQRPCRANDAAAAGGRRRRGAAARCRSTLEYAGRTARLARGRGARARVRHPARAPLRRRSAGRGRRPALPHRSRAVSRGRRSKRAPSSACSRRIFDQARRERDRILPLFEQKLASLRDRDDAIAAFESAEAAVAAAERRCAAPSSICRTRKCARRSRGLTSREVRSEGSLVTAGDDSSLLTLHRAERTGCTSSLAVPEADAELVCARARAPGVEPVDAAVARRARAPQGP